MKNEESKKYQTKNKDEYVDEIINSYINDNNHPYCVKKEITSRNFNTKIIASLCCVVALIAIAVGCYFGSKNLSKTFDGITTVSEVVGVSTADAVEKVSDSVVDVISDTGTSYGMGSGIICSSNGYIITNAHVVSGSTKVEVALHNQQPCPAEIIGTDEKADVAVLKIDAKNLKPVEMIDSDILRRGEDLIVIGNPLGALPGSVTNGIISYANRTVSLEGQNTMTLIQTNAEINSGNSGGGAFLLNGKLIGIVFAKHGAYDSEGLGFIIPSNTVKERVISILNSKKIPLPEELK